MIGDNFLKSILGLVTLFTVATTIGWAAVKFDDYLVDNLKLKSSSIIIVEALVLASFVVIYISLHHVDRNRLISDVKKLTIKEWAGFIGLSLLGVFISLLLNKSLKYWDTAEFRMTSELVKILLGGLFFFFFTKKSWSYKKLLIYVIFAVAAVYFNVI